jgi:asparagine synthase (glutamine-hydrolysing)
MHHWDETSFADIKSLPASHNLRWSNGEITIWQYADIATQPDTSRSFQDNVERFRELLIDSIRLTSRRDVDMGVCLSGGLDSTSIASVLASATDEHSVKTFTAYYTGKGNVDERPYIDHVLQRYPQIQQNTISPTDADVNEVFDRIVRLMDAPMPSSSYISQYFVMQLAASNGVKVVLDGQGSDEIMGGYMHSLYRSIADYLRAGKLDDAAKELNHHAARQNYGVRRKLDVLAKSMLAAVRDEPSLYRLEFARTAPWIAKSSPSSIPLRLEMPSGPRLNAFLYNLMRVTLLPTLLHTEDINSMAFSIESRVPFLDHRLVDLCFAMPNEHKIYRGETKRVLRAAMRGIVPDPVLDRKDKTGFITPGHIAWLRGALSHLIDGDWKDLDWAIDRTALNEVLSAYKRGDNSNALFVWRLAMLRAFLATR